jgi:hypothetical protein
MAVRCVSCTRESTKPALGGETGWHGSLRVLSSGAKVSEWWCPECWAREAARRRMEGIEPSETLDDALPMSDVGPHTD